MSGPLAQHLPDATLRRLSQYLRSLSEWGAAGTTTVSSARLARAAGTTPATLRKDLNLLGSHGRPGVGYQVDTLAPVLETALGLTTPWRVAIIGAGHLGKALSGYAGFTTRGFDVVAVLDSSPDVIGTVASGVRVEDAATLEAVVQRAKVNMAVLTVPGPAAQRLVDRLAAAGVRSILSFAPLTVNAPDGVDVRRVDLSTELQLLAHRAAPAGPPMPHRAPPLVQG